MGKKNEKIKYILAGIAVGIIIGIGLFYLLMSLRIIRPFGAFFNRAFPRNGSFGNFTIGQR